MTKSTSSDYGQIPFCIKNNPHGFGKWKNPLIDAVARAYGCRLQVVKPASKHADNAILFGLAEKASKATYMFQQIQESAFEAVCNRMEVDGVPKSNRPYCVSYYAGYVHGITEQEQTRDRIAACADEADTVARMFPQSNETYPVHTNIDAEIAAAGL